MRLPITLRLLGFCLSSVLVLASCGTDTTPPPPERTLGPWTHLNFLDRSGVFHFAVVSDRAGGHRPGVFESALDRAEALGPAFVMSVGDLLDTSDFGGTPDLITAEMARERWEEINQVTQDRLMPFFYVAGNNELRTATMEEVWHQLFGPTYYHFLYEDVLFIVLNSEDPPGSAPGSMSEAQLAWLQDTLAENEDVRWTFLFVHKPLWLYPEPSAWTTVEGLLGSRSRTAFAGHMHGYSRTEVNGNVYFGLATTGGGSDLSGVASGSFDHLAWVIMTDAGPQITNLMLDGIWGDDPAEETGRR